jgi:hypothetical protein
MADEPDRIYLRTSTEERLGATYVRVWDMSLEPKDGLTRYRVESEEQAVPDPWELLRNVAKTLHRRNVDYARWYDVMAELDRIDEALEQHDERNAK